VKSIPWALALPVAAAFLIEFPFYLSLGFDAPREWLVGLGKERAATFLALTAVLPYLAYSIATGQFRPLPLVLLVIVAGTVSFWYLLVPVTAITDALFLVILAAIFLARIFDILYPSPFRTVTRTLAVLGQLMLIHTAALTVHAVRGNPEVEFRFLPTRNEWITGIRYFAMLLPFAAAAYWALGLVRFREHPLNILLALGTFFGILWVVALSEEFFFRGLLQQWLGKWTGSVAVALIVASLLFGSAHLSFGHVFPNWRFATVAAIAGFFYGLAWKRTRTIQSSMVTHALTVTFWRVFFQ
jgi:uncharacterized protein